MNTLSLTHKENISLAMMGHSVSEQTRNKLRLWNNPSWKGEKAVYRSIHSWVVRNWGKAIKCENCGKEDECTQGYDWMNLDHKYSRDKKDWKMSCRSCHLKHDYAKGLRKPRN